MTAKPTAVVVRLPLSADQEETLFEISERDCLNSAIAAIGTHVAGGEFDYQTLDPKTKTPLADLSEIIINQRSALAAAQTENARLRGHLEVVRSHLKEAPSVTARRGALGVIEEALKGPVS